MVIFPKHYQATHSPLPNRQRALVTRVALTSSPRIHQAFIDGKTIMSSSAKNGAPPTAPKQQNWGMEQYERCRDMFNLFDTTNGRAGWDPDEKENPSYIVGVCMHDEIVGPYGSNKNGGFVTNKKSTKLLNGYKKAAEKYLGVLANTNWHEANEALLREEKERFDRRYSFAPNDQRLGSGAFGIVYKGYDENNNPVAVKVPSVRSRVEAKEALEHAGKEVRNWKKISGSPFILDLLEFFVLAHGNGNFPVLCTVSPCITGGTLMDYMVEQGYDGLPHCQAWLASKQLMLAVKHMHIHEVVHRDIKPDNMLVVRGKDGALEKVLLIDLGTAKRFVGESRTNTFVGTDLYMAPEVKEGKYQMPKVDVYSIGMTVLLMAVGMCPDKANMKTWYDDRLDIEQVFQDYPGKPLVQIARRMVDKLPYSRCTLSVALKLLDRQRPSDRESSMYFAPHDDVFKEAISLMLERTNLDFLLPLMNLGMGPNTDIGGDTGSDEYQQLKALCIEFTERFQKLNGGDAEAAGDGDADEEPLSLIAPAVSTDQSIDDLD
jgi:serine/threonine protein kinase